MGNGRRRSPSVRDCGNAMVKKAREESGAMVVNGWGVQRGDREGEGDVGVKKGRKPWGVGTKQGKGRIQGERKAVNELWGA
jgi:hypothetical protein